MLRLDGVPLAGSEREAGQLFDLPRELLALRIARRGAAFVIQSRAAESLPFPMSVTGFLRKRCKPCVRIEHQALCLRPEQRLVGVLAVDIDQPLSGLP